MLSLKACVYRQAVSHLHNDVAGTCVIDSTLTQLLPVRYQSIHILEMTKALEHLKKRHIR